jgi:hypothetical protein
MPSPSFLSPGFMPGAEMWGGDWACGNVCGGVFMLCFLLSLVLLAKEEETNCLHCEENEDFHMITGGVGTEGRAFFFEDMLLLTHPHIQSHTYARGMDHHMHQGGTISSDGRRGSQPNPTGLLFVESAPNHKETEPPFAQGFIFLIIIN